MIPHVYNKIDTKTGKSYEHVFTDAEIKEIIERQQKGEKMQAILKSIRDRLTDADWVEV